MRAYGPPLGLSDEMRRNDTRADEKHGANDHKPAMLS